MENKTAKITHLRLFTRNESLFILVKANNLWRVVKEFKLTGYHFAWSACFIGELENPEFLPVADWFYNEGEDVSATWLGTNAFQTINAIQFDKDKGGIRALVCVDGLWKVFGTDIEKFIESGPCYTVTPDSLRALPVLGKDEVIPKDKELNNAKAKDSARNITNSVKELKTETQEQSGAFSVAKCDLKESDLASSFTDKINEDIERMRRYPDLGAPYYDEFSQGKGTLPDYQAELKAERLASIEIIKRYAKDKMEGLTLEARLLLEKERQFSNSPLLNRQPGENPFVYQQERLNNQSKWKVYTELLDHIEKVLYSEASNEKELQESATPKKV